MMIFGQFVRVTFRYRQPFTETFSTVETTLGQIRKFGAVEAIAARMIVGDGEKVKFEIEVGTLSIKSTDFAEGEPYDELDVAMAALDGIASACVAEGEVTERERGYAIDQMKRYGSI